VEDQQPAQAPVTVRFLEDSAQDRALVEVRERGFLGFLKKPFSLKDLDAYLQAVGLAWPPRNGGPGEP
jgi:DNA-binding response OmpR family regulator